jgi:hypothetical protein
VKNGKDFPYRLHTDNRYIVPVSEGETVKDLSYEEGNPERDAVAWVRRQLSKRAERAANKQRKEAEAAAKASEGESSGETAQAS